MQPATHGQLYLDGGRNTPEIYRYLPYGPFKDLSELELFFETTVRRDPAIILFAIIDKTRLSDAEKVDAKATSASFAGVMGLLFATPQARSIEIGHIVILKPFQRTHVTVNANGLLLAYCLDSPAEGGLGLRRVQWQAHASNNASVNAAKGFGYRFEGYIRWLRVLPLNKEGAERDDGYGPGRTNAVLSICWDDWEQGTKEAVQKSMVLRK